MHFSSLENMGRCIDWYLKPDAKTVVDLGAMDVNGSYRSLLPAHVRYTGVDLEAGPGVDVVLSDVYKLPFEDASTDVVLSGQMLEHCGQFWRVFEEVQRILRPGGIACMIAPSAGPVHRYPVDCYRFYPDSFQAIADWARLRLVHSWTDERGPWRDIVGVFQKGGQLERITQPPARTIEANARVEPHADPRVEVRKGARGYLEALRDLHDIIQPELYLEIGVRKGKSLALAQKRAIAIDPDPHPDMTTAGRDVDFYKCTSDDFFFFHRDAIKGPVQLAFIDGMHLAEFVLRDFMNVERLMDPNGVIVIDDVLPNHPLQATRERNSQIWTGDVWRFAESLTSLRPDLKLTWLDTDPSGLLVVSKLDPKNQRLWDGYNKLTRRMADRQGAEPPRRVIERSAAVAPSKDNLMAAAGRA